MVDTESSAEVAIYATKYRSDLKALDGYNDIPWGVGLKAARLLAGLDAGSVKVTDFYTAYAAASNDVSRRAILLKHWSYIKDTPELTKAAAFVGVRVAPGFSMISGDTGDKSLFFWFLDNQLYAAWMTFSRQPDWQQYVQTLNRKYGEPRLREPRRKSEFDPRYTIIAWSNEFGTARMILQGQGGLALKVNEAPPVEDAPPPEEPADTNRSAAGKLVGIATDITSGITDMVGSLFQLGEETETVTNSVIAALEKEIKENKASYHLAGIGFHSAQLKPAAEARFNWMVQELQKPAPAAKPQARKKAAVKPATAAEASGGTNVAK